MGVLLQKKTISGCCHLPTFHQGKGISPTTEHYVFWFQANLFPCEFAMCFREWKSDLRGLDRPPPERSCPKAFHAAEFARRSIASFVSFRPVKVGNSSQDKSLIYPNQFAKFLSLVPSIRVSSSLTKVCQDQI